MTHTHASFVPERASDPCGRQSTPCPACGEIECFCRPTFNAGQVLNADHLNRLVDYLLAKRRLTNRSLFGWGVVCGLEVACPPCGTDSVSVSPGHALSPCGDDIVVCVPETVPICKLINDCRETERRYVTCEPYETGDDCLAGEEEWVLAIRYQESPGRSIVGPQRAPAPGKAGGCSCGCGGKGGACTCGGAQPTRMPRSAPPSCLPVETCEGHVYEVYRLPKTTPKKPLGGDADIVDWACGLEGELMRRLCCCWTELKELFVDSLPDDGDANDNFAGAKNRAHQWCCRMKEALADFHAENPSGNCQALQRLKAVICPDPRLDNQAFLLAFYQAFLLYAVLVFEAFIACVCRAALPPCPAPVGDTRVPLATVTVRRRDCTVLTVCNWTPLRRFVVTLKTLDHWFGWIPVGDLLREMMHVACCEGFGLWDRLRGQEERDRMVIDTGAMRAGGAMATNVDARAGGAPAGATAGAANDDPIASLLRQPLSFRRPDTSGLETLLAAAVFSQRVNDGSPLRVEDFLQAVLTPGRFGADRDDSRLVALGGAADRVHPQIKVINEILRPILEMAPGGRGRSTAAPRTADESGELTELRRELAALSERVTAQDREIARLRGDHP